MSDQSDLFDFRNFLALAFHTLGLPSPTRLQYDFAWQLQHGSDRLVLMCWRGFGKSTIACIKNTWELWCDQQRKVLNVSAAAKKADENNQLMLRIIGEMPETTHLTPRREQRRSSIEFDVNGALPALAPSARSLGIGSNSVIGSRGDCILADDIETLDNAQTIGMQEKIEVKARELGGAVLKSKDDFDDGFIPNIRYLGTPQIERSFYFKLRERGYQTVIYPARYPTKDQEDAYAGCLAPILKSDLEKDPTLRGQPVEPERFGEQVLEERLREYLAPGFALQFMLLPTLADPERYPLSLNDMIVTDIDADVAPERLVWNSKPEHVIKNIPNAGFRGRDEWRAPVPLKEVAYQPYNHKIMAVDPSTTGADECAYVVLGVLNSYIYILDAGGYLRGDTEDTLEALADIAKKWDVRQVVAEKNMGGGLWGKLFQPYLLRKHPGCAVTDLGVSGQKEVRIAQIVGPVMAQHRLVVSQKLIWKDFKSTQKYKNAVTYQLFHQMSRLTLDRGVLVHDDRLDALALGITHLQDNMGRDWRREQQRREHDDMQKLIDDWEDKSLGLGGKPKPKYASWW